MAFRLAKYLTSQLCGYSLDILRRQAAACMQWNCDPQSAVAAGRHRLPDGRIRGLTFSVPNISVFDPDGRLPLNLQRTGLVVNNYPFDDLLANDVIRDFIAFALVLGPTSLPDDFWHRPLKYPGLGQGDLSGVWYFTRDGFGYVDAAILSSFRSNSILFVTLMGWEKRASLCRLINGPTIGLSTSHWVSTI